MKSQKVPNITLDPAEQQKRAEDFAIMKHRLREDAMRRKLDPSSKFDSAFNFCNQQRNVLPVKNESKSKLFGIVMTSANLNLFRNSFVWHCEVDFNLMS